jgi:hypothetical protein
MDTLSSVKTIPIHEVEARWQEFCEVNPERAAWHMQRFMEKQPALVAYLAAVENHDAPEEERGKTLFVGLAAMHVIMSKHSRLPQVTPEEIEAAEERNITFMQQLEEGSEMAFLEGVQSAMGTYNQMPLLGAVLEAFMEGNEDTPELLDEDSGMGFIYVKTVIDCLDCLDSKPS